MCQFKHPDPLDAAKGCAFGLLVAGGLWGWTVVVVWLLIR